MLFYIATGQSWQTYTNTSHVYDLLIKDNNNIYAGTWGGAINLFSKPDISNPSDLYNDFNSKLWTTNDGLSSNDIRTIEYVISTGSMWVGSSTEGISIINPNGFQMINSSNGLPSNKIRKIIEHESQIFVATDMGLSVFYYLETVNFPLLLHQYNVQNTSGGLVSNDISDMVLSSSKYLYLSTASGLSYVHVDSLNLDSSWRKWNSINSPLFTGYAFGLSANDTHLVVSNQNRVFKRPVNPFEGSWSMYGTSSGIEDHWISSVEIDSESNIWISYGIWDEDLLSYNLYTNTLLTKLDASGVATQWLKGENGLAHYPISKISSREGKVYLASWGGGIYKLNGSDWDNYFLEGIAFPKITGLVTDNSNAVWLYSGIIGISPVRKSTLGVSKLHQSHWTSYNISNSPLHTDNVLNMAVDASNRKWFGTWDVTANSPAGWNNGISIFDEDQGTWHRLTRNGMMDWNDSTSSWSPLIPGSITIRGNTIGYLSNDRSGNMLVACYDHGVNIINQEMTDSYFFTIPNSVRQRILYLYHNGSQYFIGTNNDRGLVIWNHPSVPQSPGTYTIEPDPWVIPDPPELSNCIVYGVATINTTNEGRQHWIAASTGLFMWNETYWYKYDTTIKRQRYSNGVWVQDQLYYVDEERLFGSVRTTPTSILLDPFNRLWIGSLENGFSMYDSKTERFTNFFRANSPLLSNYITALGYEPAAGLLLIGTPDGLNTYSIGKAVITTQKLERVIAYPNPFRPDTDGYVRIVNLPENSMPAGKNICRIYDSSGAIVAEISQNEYARFDWNGKNKDGKKSGSGIYFYVVTDKSGNSKRGKIALIR